MYMFLSGKPMASSDRNNCIAQQNKGDANSNQGRLIMFPCHLEMFQQFMHALYYPLLVPVLEYLFMHNLQRHERMLGSHNFMTFVKYEQIISGALHSYMNWH